MNSPKEEFLRQFNNAFLKNDIAFILNSLTNDVHWEMVGDRTFKNKEEVKASFEEMNGNEGLTSLDIDTIITHGKSAAVSGTMKMKNKDGKETTYSFCDVYGFSGFKNPKIKKLTAYIIKTANTH